MLVYSINYINNRVNTTTKSGQDIYYTIFVVVNPLTGQYNITVSERCCKHFQNTLWAAPSPTVCVHIHCTHVHIHCIHTVRVHTLYTRVHNHCIHTVCAHTLYTHSMCTYCYVLVLFSHRAIHYYTISMLIVPADVWENSASRFTNAIHCSRSP